MYSVIPSPDLHSHPPTTTHRQTEYEKLSLGRCMRLLYIGTYIIHNFLFSLYSSFCYRAPSFLGTYTHMYNMYIIFDFSSRGRD